MNVFHIYYRNTQGTLMRILTAAARRGIELPYVQAEPAEHAHKVTLLLAVSPKQTGQLCRDWQAIVDVIEVRSGARKDFDQPIAWSLPHPTASPGVPTNAAARQASA